MSISSSLPWFSVSFFGVSISSSFKAEAAELEDVDFRGEAHRYVGSNERLPCAESSQREQIALATKKTNAKSSTEFEQDLKPLR